jgi:hypothetical protein
MEQFDKGFEVFANWQTLLLCLGIFLGTYGIRRVVETAWSGSKTNKWWTEVLLPMGPIGTGAILGYFAKSYPWPMPVADNLWAKVFYGASCGLASGWVYNRFRSVLKAMATNDQVPESVVKVLPPAPKPTEPEANPELPPPELPPAA